VRHICPYYNIPVLQDSFELPRGGSSRDGDIEMGMQADPSDNLKGFLKKVLFTKHFGVCILHFAAVLYYPLTRHFILLTSCFDTSG
jgi:hypothetical protein